MSKEKKSHKIWPLKVYSNLKSRLREDADQWHRSLQEFAFEGQNMTFTVNVLFTCITYCDAGPGYD